MERRPWTPYEDGVLKNLYEKVKLNKWSLIARRMEDEYHLSPRTGKQCRQRYNNHLNPLMMKDSWSEKEETLLFRLHDELGNKWAIIAASIGGRTDNSVKNHFFAKLRKSMRKVNKIICDKFKKQLKEIKLNVLYKIVEASEERFKKIPLCSPQTSKFSCSLKNKILAFAYDNQKQPNQTEFRQLITQIHTFGKTYKRKPKQLRRVVSLSSQNIDLSLIPSNTLKDMGEESQPQEVDDSEDEIIHKIEAMEVIQDHNNSSDSAERKMNLRSKGSKLIDQQIESEQHLNAVDSLLQKKGLLQEQNSQFPSIPVLLRRYTSSQFLMQGNHRQPFFLSESQNQNNLPAPLIFDHTLKRQSYEDPLFR